MITRFLFLSVILLTASYIISNGQAAENIFPNIGFTGIGTGINAPLNKLHLHLDGENAAPQPVIRFSYGTLAPTDGQPIGQLAFCSTNGNALYYSAHAGAGDLTIRTASTAGKLILSSQNSNGAILFTTTQATAAVGVAAVDQERMRITSMGHVGIWQDEPQELLHIGDKMTFHVGFTNNYIGYNVYRDGSNVDRVIMSETSPAIAHPLKLGMTLDGILEFGVGKPTTHVAGSAVDWYETTTAQLAAFAGLTIKEMSGKGCASFGWYSPDANSRLLIKGFSATNANALAVVSSGDAALLTVRNDGKSGFGEANPDSRLVVKGSGNDNTTTALNVKNSDNNLLMVVKDNGSVGIGIEPDDETSLHVFGDVVFGSQKCTTSVNIGGNAPVSTLSVDGVIFAREMHVTHDNQWVWPDYVFAEEYDLQPLSEIKAFIKQYSHLPEMPSAEEVKERGFSLNGLQVKLLKKVEELTLHLIELSDKNLRLEKAIEMLLLDGGAKK